LSQLAVALVGQTVVLVLEALVVVEEKLEQQGLELQGKGLMEGLVL
jgi:hypothetical protein